MRKWLTILLALLWGTFALVAIKWVGSDNFVEFDPELKLSAAIMSLSFESELVAALPNLDEGSRGSIFHLVQGDCFCERLSDGHKANLSDWANKRSLTSKVLDLADYPSLLTYIPSTPAVLVVDENKNLVYLGPYSVGFGCFEDTGLVDLRIKPYFDKSVSAETETMHKYSTSLKSTDSININKLSQIQSEAVGCYCPTASI
jgi:hypothetical protein